MTVRRSKHDRVLVVDDDAALAEMLAIVLEGEDLRTRICNTGDEVMAAFEQFRPDVILLDRMLPGLEGMEVCRQIRTVSGVPIIMLTAKGDTADIVDGLEAGADDYITKPFRNSGFTYPAGVRSARLFDLGSRTGLQSRSAAAKSLGLPPSRRHKTCQRPHDSLAPKDRGRC